MLAYFPVDLHGQLPEQFIARLMATGIVDNLELVQVDVAQCMLGCFIIGFYQGLGQPGLELAPVKQSGQVIVRGLVGKLLRHTMEF